MYLRNVTAATVLTIDCIWELDRVSVTSPTENNSGPASTKLGQFNPNSVEIQTPPC